jgi:PhzF family phenazine biosynthesis protein
MPRSGRARLGHVPRPITYVDVFTDSPYRGNPVAVVHDAAGLSTEDMQRFARWTNLSETTFLLPPTEPGADYLLRIFTPVAELPFAGHPTLGSCHAWLAAGGKPESADEVVQQCGAGLVTIRRGDRLAFAAPPLVRSGPIDAGLLADVVAALGIEPSAVVDSAWVDNGPGWLAVLLGSAEEVLAVRPSFIDQDIGVVGPHAAGSPEAFEVRAFFPVNGALREDPVTGSLNASVAQWLLDSGRASAPYVASQGTALGWAGRAHISRDDDGTIWVGGGTVTCVTGEVRL